MHWCHSPRVDLLYQVDKPSARSAVPVGLSPQNEWWAKDCDLAVQENTLEPQETLVNKSCMTLGSRCAMT